MENPEERITGDEPVQIPYFVAESMCMHMGRANRRMLLAIIIVCLTCISTILIFVFSYNAREKGWIDLLCNTPGVTEALSNGVHK